MIRLLLLKILSQKILKNMLPVFNSKPEIQMNSGNFFFNFSLQAKYLHVLLYTMYIFSFNENDVIEVDLNAPAEPEWFFGTCQGRAGLFPQGTYSHWIFFRFNETLNFPTESKIKKWAKDSNLNQNSSKLMSLLAKMKLHRHSFQSKPQQYSQFKLLPLF